MHRCFKHWWVQCVLKYHITIVTLHFSVGIVMIYCTTFSKYIKVIIMTL